MLQASKVWFNRIVYGSASQGKMMVVVVRKKKK